MERVIDVTAARRQFGTLLDEVGGELLARMDRASKPAWALAWV